MENVKQELYLICYEDDGKGVIESNIAKRRLIEVFEELHVDNEITVYHMEGVLSLHEAEEIIEKDNKRAFTVIYVGNDNSLHFADLKMSTNIEDIKSTMSTDEYFVVDDLLLADFNELVVKEEE